jgi:hypothetical protein
MMSSLLSKSLWTSAAIALAAFVGLAGCAVDAAPTDGSANQGSASEGSAGTPARVTHDVNLLGGVTGTVGGLTGALGICQPLTCCFPSGGGWGSDAFESGLQALGCTTPAAYTQSAGADMWWLYSRCPMSARLSSLVAEYSGVAPYEAQFVVNECLALDAVGSLELDSVFVEFDPTCSSCKPAR